MPSRFRLVVISLLVIFVLVAVAITFDKLRDRRLSQSTADKAPHQPLLLSRPAPRDNSFVGSEACAECHQQIFDQFKASPMGQSMSTVKSAVQVENFDTAVVRPSAHRHYQVSRDAEFMQHHEILLDEQGDAFRDQGEEISFIVGSGQRGRSYLIDRGGLLFQSPIGWYAHGQRWDLSPGYTPEQHARFSRRIGDGCLYCHAGRMLNDGLAMDRYEQPVFAELAIGCERCHGPGEEHVRLHATGKDATATSADTIVNPADLSVSKREAVCNQCHLLGRSVIRRYGRGFFDFRPGDELEDIFVVLSQETDAVLHGQLKAVNQVEQMRASQCYKASDGRLGCISCHDPHAVPSAEQRVEHFRQRCINCHETAGCSLDLAQREQPPANNSCMHCHMPAAATMDVPHTSMTDHRILRTPGEPHSTDEPAAGSQGELTVFDEADRRMPFAEVKRARGIALMTSAWNKRDEYLAATALSHLLECIDGDVKTNLATIDDLSLLGELASSYLMLRDHDLAGQCWKRVLELDPSNESALMGVAKVCEEFQNEKMLGEYLDKLLAINPTSEEALALLVKQRHYSNDTAGAMEAAERTLLVNPARTEMRAWLVDMYRRQGETDKMREHEDFLSKMDAVQPNAAADPAN